MDGVQYSRNGMSPFLVRPVLILFRDGTVQTLEVPGDGYQEVGLVGTPLSSETLLPQIRAPSTGQAPRQAPHE